MAETNPGIGNLISWYSMDEASGQARIDSHNALNAADNNNVGTVAGVVGNDADYTPDDYHNVSDNALHNWTDTLSILGWFNPDDVTAVNMVLVSKWLPDTQNEWGLELRNDELRFYVADALDDAGANRKNTDAANLTVGNDFFFVVEYDGTQGVSANRVKFYINNALEASSEDATLPASLQNGTADIEFGRFNSLGRQLDGQLGEIVIAKRTYTTDEKSWFYNSGAGRAYSDLSDFIPRTGSII